MGMSIETIKTFKDLNAWKHAHEVVLETYRITKNFPNDEQFGLTNQMRRASVSVTSNIAEGFGRLTKKDKAHFYSIAKGSLFELQSQLQIAYDLQYLDKQFFEKINKDIERTLKLTYGLIKSAMDH